MTENERFLQTTYFTTNIPRFPNTSRSQAGRTGWRLLEKSKRTLPLPAGKDRAWDFIIDQDLDFLLGNVEVCSPAGSKPGESRMDDLLKAQAYQQSNRLHRCLSTKKGPDLRRLMDQPYDFSAGM